MISERDKLIREVSIKISCLIGSYIIVNVAYNKTLTGHGHPCCAVFCGSLKQKVGYNKGRLYNISILGNDSNNRRALSHDAHTN